MKIEHFMSGNMLRLLKKHNVQCAMCNVKRKSTTFVELKLSHDAE